MAMKCTGRKGFNVLPRKVSSFPSMVHRSGDSLVVRSVVSGNNLYGDDEGEEKMDTEIYENDLEMEQVDSSFDVSGENRIDSQLPDCKVKRNYHCVHCSFYTQNPRNFLYHLKDVHHEKIKVYECPYCIYASKHSQKLQRHIRMVHEPGSENQKGRSVKKIPKSSPKPSPVKKTPESSPRITETFSVASNCTSPRAGGMRLGFTSPKSPRSPCGFSPRSSANEILENRKNEKEEIFQEDLVAEEMEEEIEAEEEEVEEVVDDEDDDEEEEEEEDEMLPEEVTIVDMSDYKTKDDRKTKPTPKEICEYKCSVCHFTSKSKILVHRHEQVAHLKKKFYRCSKCNYVTYVKARYTKHVKYHSMPMIKCDKCDFRTPYKWNLDRHLKNHLGGGMFVCPLCNFTAHIKQSLTVHIQNHHLTPEQARVHRRRNKVGASDEAEAQIDREEMELLRMEREENALEDAKRDATDGTEPSFEVSNFEVSLAAEPKDDIAPVKKKPKIKITLKKMKLPKSGFPLKPERHNFENDFIHPDDIIHKNGKVYIKHLKCRYCNYKAAWENSLMRHEYKIHGISMQKLKFLPSKKLKKVPRPVPNLIPIQTLQGSCKNTATILKIPQVHRRASASPDPIDSENQDDGEDSVTLKQLLAQTPKDISRKKSSLVEIMSATSDDGQSSELFPNYGNETELKDSHELGNSDSPIVLEKEQLPEKTVSQSSKVPMKRKASSFFDKLKEKLSKTDVQNFVCHSCGYESKCLAESIRHQKLHATSQSSQTSSPLLSSTRCQYCRQRCKTRADLINHMKTCSKATKKGNDISGDLSANPDTDTDLNSDTNANTNPDTRSVATNNDKQLEETKEPLLQDNENNTNSIEPLLQEEQQDTESQDLPSEDKTEYLECKEVQSPKHKEQSLDKKEQPHLRKRQPSKEKDEDFKGKESPGMENRVFVWNNLIQPEPDAEDLEVKRCWDDQSEDIQEDAHSVGEDSQDNSLRSKSPSEGSLFGIETSPGIGAVTGRGSGVEIEQAADSEHSGPTTLKKVYKCPQCPFWATTASRFHVHIVGHYNKKPFECSQCSYRSNWRWDITKHIKLKSARDVSHQRAKVIMTDQTGERNYEKYDAHLTLLQVQEAGLAKPAESSGSGKRSRGKPPTPTIPAATTPPQASPPVGKSGYYPIVPALSPTSTSATHDSV